MIPAAVIAGVVIVGDPRGAAVPCQRDRTPVHALASPKSSTLTAPSARTLMLAGFEIAMDDPLLVGRVERLGDLPCQRKSPHRPAVGRPRAFPRASGPPRVPARGRGVGRSVLPASSSP